MNITKIFLKQNKLLNFALFIFSLLFFLLIYFMLINFNSSKIEINSVNKFQDMNLYQLTDNLIEEREVSFFSIEENYNVLNNFVNEIIYNDKFDYYNVVWQPIGISNFPNKIEFASYYEFDGLDNIYVMGNEKYRSSKSIQINQNVLDFNSVQLSTGTFFEEKDFYFDLDERTIPIVLGYEYLDYYSLKDILTIDYYGEKFKGEIIGFTKKNQTIFSNYDPQLILDRYIILPSMSIKENPTDLLNTENISELFVKALILSKTTGNIISNLDALELKALINNIEKTTGFKDYQVIGANSTAIELLSKMVEVNQTMIILISIISFIIINILYYLVIGLKVKKELDTYLVLIISGVQNSVIQKIILYEFVKINIIGLILASLIFFIIFNVLLTLLIKILVIAIIILLIQVLLAKLIIRKILLTTNIVEKLKGD